jgi:hypothetical protein
MSSETDKKHALHRGSSKNGLKVDKKKARVSEVFIKDIDEGGMSLQIDKLYWIDCVQVERCYQHIIT